MLRKTFLFLQSEFEKQKKKPWPRKTYGSLFIMRGPDRIIPNQNLKFVTRESNRLQNFTDRYSIVYDSLDMEKNKEKLNIDANDVRWDDYRKLYFKCNQCGTKFARRVYQWTRFRRGCPKCTYLLPPSPLLGKQHTRLTLKEAFPEILNELVDVKLKEIKKGDTKEKDENTVEDASGAEKKGESLDSDLKNEYLSPSQEQQKEKIRTFYGDLPVSSRFSVKSRCKMCHGLYTCSLRMLTGMVEPTQGPLGFLTPPSHLRETFIAPDFSQKLNSRKNDENIKKSEKKEEVEEQKGKVKRDISLRKKEKGNNRQEKQVLEEEKKNNREGGEGFSLDGQQLHPVGKDEEDLASLMYGPSVLSRYCFKCRWKVIHNHCQKELQDNHCYLGLIKDEQEKNCSSSSYFDNVEDDLLKQDEEVDKERGQWERVREGELNSSIDREKEGRVAESVFNESGGTVKLEILKQVPCF